MPPLMPVIRPNSTPQARLSEPRLAAALEPKEAPQHLGSTSNSRVTVAVATAVPPRITRPWTSTVMKPPLDPGRAAPVPSGSSRLIRSLKLPVKLGPTVVTPPVLVEATEIARRFALPAGPAE